eukprot:365012-Chlamydomonas_euryale.AAC.6
MCRRPQFEAYHACRGRGRPETEDVHARPRKCLRHEAEGHLCACMSEAEGRGRGRGERPETGGRDKHVLCKDDPAKVSHTGKRSGPLMHTA